MHYFHVQEFMYSLGFYLYVDKRECVHFIQRVQNIAVHRQCVYFFHFILFRIIFFHFILVNVNKSPLEISLAYLYFTATKFLFYFWDSSWCCTAF